MKITFEELCEEISLIVEKEEIISFYIGKTDNIEKRKEDEKYKDYILIPKVTGDSERISKLEEKLIENFEEHEKCENSLSWSSGNPDADLIYLAYEEDIYSSETITPDKYVGMLFRGVCNSVPVYDIDEIEF
jgi:hypothetical protein